MPTISFTVPSETVDAICGMYDYQATIPNNGGTIPNPETKNQFAKRVFSIYLVKLTRSWLKQRDEDVAGGLADANSANITIT